MERLARAANYISSPLLPPSRFLWDHNCQWEGGGEGSFSARPGPPNRFEDYVPASRTATLVSTPMAEIQPEVGNLCSRSHGA